MIYKQKLRSYRTPIKVEQPSMSSPKTPKRNMKSPEKDLQFSPRLINKNTDQLVKNRQMRLEQKQNENVQGPKPIILKETDKYLI